MKFSIIVPAYNIEKYIDECLDSILNQSFNNYEIVLIDDGSTDNTPRICDDYAKRYPNNIVVIHQKNAGLSAARNAGIAKATGEYIIFVDGDDKLSYNHLLHDLSNVSNNNDMVVFGWKSFDESDKKLAKVHDYHEYKSEYDSGISFLTSALNYEHLYRWEIWKYAIRKSFWTKNNFHFKQGIKYEDVDITYKIILKSKRINVLKEVGYYYRESRAGSILNTISVQTCLDGLSIIKNNIDQISSNKSISDCLKDALCNNFSCLYYSFLIQSSRITNSKERDILLNKLKDNQEICKYTKEKRQKLVYKAICLIGLSNTSRLLGLRRKIQIIRGKKDA